MFSCLDLPKPCGLRGVALPRAIGGARGGGGVAAAGVAATGTAQSTSFVRVEWLVTKLLRQQHSVS